jgi:hypothetical protein
LFTSTTPYRRAFGSGLILKSLCDERDVERVSTFNGQIFGQDVAAMTRALILHHPSTRPEHWLFVEDESSEQIVSSLCLIPWQWRYEDMTLKSGEMGIVSTLDSYRNRGIVREQITRFKELLRDEGFHLSHIQGIPYFYRQFGYEYALPLEAQWQLELRNVPDVPEEMTSCYHFRPATVEDIPVLMRLYDEATRHLDISTLRGEDIWQFLLIYNMGTAIEGETWLMLDADNQPIAYWRITWHGFGEGLIVGETSRLSIDAAKVLLHWLKAMALERGKPYIRFNLPVSNDLLRAACSYGAYDTGIYAWQIHIVDVVRLLRQLTPVLERRIANSPFAGLSQKVVINLYREAFELHFKQGKLLSVNTIGFSHEGEIRLPPMLLAPLLLGYRSHEELRQMFPDVSIHGQSRYLVDVLFPKLDSFIFTNY